MTSVYPSHCRQDTEMQEDAANEVMSRNRIYCIVAEKYEVMPVLKRQCIPVGYKLLRNGVDERLHYSLCHESRLGTK